jgi:hypothetical protein
MVRVVRLACPYCYRNWWIPEACYYIAEKTECFYKVLGCTDVWHKSTCALPRSATRADMTIEEKEVAKNARKSMANKRFHIADHMKSAHSTEPLPVVAMPLISTTDRISRRDSQAGAKRRKAKSRRAIEKKKQAGGFTPEELAKQESQKKI